MGIIDDIHVSSFMSYKRIVLIRIIRLVPRVGGTTYLSRSFEFATGLQWRVCVAQSLVFCSVLQLFVLLVWSVTVVKCIVCPSIYVWWLPLWYVCNVFFLILKEYIILENVFFINNRCTGLLLRCKLLQLTGM